MRRTRIEHISSALPQVATGSGIGGLATMAPVRRDDVISLGFKSIVSGTLTTCLMGAIVGAIS